MFLLDLFRPPVRQQTAAEALFDDLLATNDGLIGKLNAIGAELDETRSMLADAEHENAELKKLVDSDAVEIDADMWAARALKAERLVLQLLDVAPQGIDNVVLADAKEIAARHGHVSPTKVAKPKKLARAHG